MMETSKRKDVLRMMIKVRAFEEKLNELYQRKVMFGSPHSYRGQEAIAAGVCAALKPTDMIASYHRGTGHIIAKGADLYKLMCEVVGRADGYSQGRGGKMHMGDMSFGFIGNTGTVGGTVPIATGTALAAKMKGDGRVSVSFLGDGGMNQGIVHEAMNFAGLWKLPVIYVCENNLYAMTVSVAKSTAVERMADRALAYGFKGQQIDGNDADVVYEATLEAAERARKDGGSTLLECVTYRWDGHFGGDPGTAYRTKEEIAEWKKRCPIKRLTERLTEAGDLSQEELDIMTHEAYAEVEAAATRAEAAALPEVACDPNSVFAESEMNHE